MSWTPSRELKRAVAVVGDIEQAADACGWEIASDPRLHYRITELVAQAIERAFLDALEPFQRATPAPQNGHAEAGESRMNALEPAFPWWQNAPTPSVVPATADPVGADLPQDDGGDWMAPNRDRLRDAIATPKAQEDLQSLIDASAPKKRGRPKGSTNKAKKKAKAVKAKAVPAPDEGVPEVRAEDAA